MIIVIKNKKLDWYKYKKKVKKKIIIIFIYKLNKLENILNVIYIYQ